MYFSGNVGSSPSSSAPSAPPRPARPEPNANVARYTDVDVDAESACDTAVVDRGAQAAAEAGRDSTSVRPSAISRAHDDDEQAIDADTRRPRSPGDR